MALVALVLVSPVFGQLNQNCTISVLNRNVQVNPDGTWVLANIPVNQGLVRARATCILSGLTKFGQSALFTVPLNGAITLQPIIFGPITPIPSALTLTATPTSITKAGATSQIKAIASYSTGNPVDVSAASSGTTYTSSNPAIATVSANGLVSGISNGTVIITAYNEGTGGSAAVTVGIPPQISITSPATGTTVTQGATIPITVAVVGGTAPLSVSFTVNGRIEFTTVSAPYIFEFTVPTGITSFTIGASVLDATGASVTASTIAIMAVPDPLTTVTGMVVDSSNNPVTGASVNCAGVTGTTAAGGSFSIPGVPTAQGNIVCFVTYNQLSGSSAAVAPVLAGTTNVGQIVLGSLTSLGTDFWMTFQNYPYGNGAQLFVLSNTTANYTVSATGFTVSGTVTPSAPATVAIPNSLQITSNQAIESKGIHLTSDAPVTATFFYPAQYTNDTYLAIPTALLGTQYYAVTYNSTSGSPYGAEFDVVATQNNTTVTIIPSCASASGTAAGTTLHVTLSAGQTYQYLCNGGDATGTPITSNNPIAVVAGAGCIALGNSACDILSEMMFPVNLLYGTDFYTAPFPGVGLDFIRVIAANNNTTLTVDNGTTTQAYPLNAGQFKEFDTKTPMHYTSNLPISVVQYFANSGAQNPAFGDPLEMQIVPTTAFRPSSRFYSPSGFAEGNFVVIIAPNGAVSSVLLNGAPVTGFSALPGGQFQYVVTPVVTAQSVVTANQPVGVYAIGFTPYGSYGSPTIF